MEAKQWPIADCVGYLRAAQTANKNRVRKIKTQVSQLKKFAMISLHIDGGQRKWIFMAFDGVKISPFVSQTFSFVEPQGVGTRIVCAREMHKKA